jgi:hypothetical protein
MSLPSRIASRKRTSLTLPLRDIRGVTTIDENAVMVSTYLPEENAWYYKTISVIGGETMKSAFERASKIPLAIPPQDDLQDRFLHQKAAEQCIRQSSPPYPAQASHTVVLQLWNRTGRGVRAKLAVSPRRFRLAHDRVNAGAHSSSLLHYFLIPLSGPIWLDPNNSTQRVSWTVSLRLEMPFSPMRPSMPVCLA